MKKKYLLSFFLGLFLQNLSAQPFNPHCDNSRYLTESFTLAAQPTTVQYGANTTYAGTAKNLMMDVYQPQGDIATKRPVLIMAFGGSFIGGSRTQSPVVDWCKYYAKRGYVTVSIDYRVYDGDLIAAISDTTRMIDAVVKAVSDMKAAVRFLRQDAYTTNQFKIDTNFIFVGGISAGAITACHTAYLDDLAEIPPFVQTAVNNNGGISGNSSTNYQYSSKVAGVVSLSGGLYRSSMVDAGDNIPLIAIHETGDQTVPYHYGYTQVGGFNIVSINGDHAVDERVAALGFRHHLTTVNGNGHTAYLGTATDAAFKITVANNLHDIMCGTTINTTSALDQNESFGLAPNPAKDYFVINRNSTDTDYSVSIYDNMGRLIIQENNISTSNHTISSDGLSAGLYHVVIRLNDAKNTILRQKLIKE